MNGEQEVITAYFHETNSDLCLFYVLGGIKNRMSCKGCFYDLENKSVSYNNVY